MRQSDQVSITVSRAFRERVNAVRGSTSMVQYLDEIELAGEAVATARCSDGNQGDKYGMDVSETSRPDREISDRQVTRPAAVKGERLDGDVLPPGRVTAPSSGEPSSDEGLESPPASILPTDAVTCPECLRGWGRHMADCSRRQR